MSFVQNTTAPELVLLLKSPNPSSSHSPHCSQSDFSPVILSASLTTSLLCLNLFMACCPDAPAYRVCTWFTPISSHLHPLPNTKFMPNCPWVPKQIQSLSIGYSLYLECSLPSFTRLIPNYLSVFLQKATLDNQDQALCSQMTLHSGLQQHVPHSIMIACYRSVSPARQKLLRVKPVPGRVVSPEPDQQQAAVNCLWDI